jgi:hypothetical protein
LTGAAAQTVTAFRAARAVQQADSGESLQNRLDSTPSHRQTVCDITSAFKALPAGVPSYIQHDRDSGIGPFATHEHRRSLLDRGEAKKFTSSEGYIGQ